MEYNTRWAVLNVRFLLHFLKSQQILQRLKEEEEEKKTNK